MAKKSMKQGLYLDDIETNSSVKHTYSVGEVVLAIMRFLSIKQILDLEKTYGAALSQDVWIKYHHAYNPSIMRYAVQNGVTDTILILDQTSIGYIKSLSYDRLTKSAKYKIKWESRLDQSPYKQDQLYDSLEESLIRLSDVRLVDRTKLVEECKLLYG